MQALPVKKWINLLFLFYFLILFKNNDYQHSVAQCLQLMLRLHSHREAFFKLDGVQRCVCLTDNYLVKLWGHYGLLLYSWNNILLSIPYTLFGYFRFTWQLTIKYCKIPKISPRAYIFQRPFLRGLFLEGLIFGGAYLRREICVSKLIGLAL